MSTDSISGVISSDRAVLTDPLASAKRNQYLTLDNHALHDALVAARALYAKHAKPVSFRGEERELTAANALRFRVFYENELDKVFGGMRYESPRDYRVFLPGDVDTVDQTLVAWASGKEPLPSESTCPQLELFVRQWWTHALLRPSERLELLEQADPYVTRFAVVEAVGCLVRLVPGACTTGLPAPFAPVTCVGGGSAMKALQEQVVSVPRLNQVSVFVPAPTAPTRWCWTVLYQAEALLLSMFELVVRRAAAKIGKLKWPENAPFYQPGFGRFFAEVRLVVGSGGSKFEYFEEDFNKVLTKGMYALPTEVWLADEYTSPAK